jgi:cobalamin synthase
MRHRENVVSPAVKYTLGRFGLFVVVFVLLLPVPLNIWVKAMIALVASAAFSYFLLARWRNEMAEQLSSAAERRRAEKQRLRAALAGDETAAAAGDRAADPGRDEK